MQEDRMLPSGVRYQRILRVGKRGNYAVYALVDPRDMVVRYVGYSGQVQKRYLGHCRGRSSVPVAAWIEELKAHGLAPILWILEEHIPDHITAERREWHWTAFFLAEGAPLLNNISDSIREDYARKGKETPGTRVQ